MEVAASIARFIALADLLVTKYSKIVDAWKDAPSAIVSIRDYLRTLKPIVVCLEELKALSSNQLVRNGLKIAAFKRTMKSLEDLADDLLKTPSDVKLWARTKWTFGKNEKARELGRSLDSDIGVFSLVLLLAVQLVPHSKCCTRDETSRALSPGLEWRLTGGGLR
ncbi:hypothetical protein BZA05DRAFT_244270 [Tricharina praecox]|uniref:uncharacterized protein n=1 Tax=Tricharina praecox TaxID=43433 RepID=UPI00221E674F|nr:uncharacterized protein BZA05DRAFT_244270 [Tricharina praecox]KAI5854547.1 hypothetical protein BZA05DRAFT_244270 [Tricharina praecox]